MGLKGLLPKGYEVFADKNFTKTMLILETYIQN